MTADEMERFLREANLAKLATIDPDGTPHVVPIWYLRDGTELVMISQPATRKVRNIRRDPRVTVCIDRATAPYAGVIVRGVATLELVASQELAVPMAVRYLGRDAGILVGEKYTSSDLATIRVPIGQPFTWDYSKEQ